MWDKVVAKIFSARFLMALLFTITYCLIELACVYLVYKKVMSVEVYIAQLATFTVIMREIAGWYFERDDRPTSGGGK